MKVAVERRVAVEEDCGRRKTAVEEGNK